MDPLALAAAAGRLYQAVTKETVEQFTNAEAWAWTALLEALQVHTYNEPQPLEVGGYIDPIRYLEVSKGDSDA